ncbi:MAG TPA: Gfo/Idh/MocA family oxidoreductase [Caulobacteraceae bacterium]|nr:Gfo/Idh/MocA family oxidoreductase [Caulobacteraceae bacterium]
MAKVRIGLLGASKIAPTAVVGPVGKRDDFIITAVAARDPARAQRYAQTHGIAAVAADYRALVERDDVDVVYNGLPPAGHAEWTLAALEAGKAVLCEKPFARDAGEARTMVEGAKAKGLTLLEAFHYRLHNVMRQAVRLVREGAIGKPQRAAAEFHAPIPRSAEELRWRADLGGGAIMDLGCYPLHAVRSLIGEEPTIQSASAVWEEGVDAETRASLVFPSGVTAEIACSMTPERPSAWLWVEGDNGRLDIVNFLAPQIGCRFTTTVDGMTTEHPTDGPTTYEAQLAHLAEVLAGRAEPLVGGVDAVANMAAIDAIKAAARG